LRQLWPEMVRNSEPRAQRIPFCRLPSHFHLHWLLCSLSIIIYPKFAYKVLTIFPNMPARTDRNSRTQSVISWLGGGTREGGTIDSQCIDSNSERGQDTLKTVTLAFGLLSCITNHRNLSKFQSKDIPVQVFFRCDGFLRNSSQPIKIEVK